MLKQLLALVALSLAACSGGAQETPAGKPGAQPAMTPSASAQPAVTTYGAPLASTDRVAFATVAGSPDAYAGKTVVIEGHVRRACKNKGCWMELATSADAAGVGARVTFKDYGFFVPTDSQGAMARVEGVVEVKTLTADEVKHYEDEGATVPGKAADGTAKELRIVASGVEMWRG